MTTDKVHEVLPEIVRRLCDALQPERIYLFGSCAYGTPGRDSDVDLLVVVPRSDMDFFERGVVARRALRRLGVPIDVLVYTKRMNSTAGRRWRSRWSAQ
jgi:uncharacterized protein